MLAGGIFGTPVMPTLLTRALIGFGMLLGVVGVASLFAVSGAVTGAVVGALPRVTVREPHAVVPVAHAAE